MVEFGSPEQSDIVQEGQARCLTVGVNLEAMFIHNGLFSLAVMQDDRERVSPEHRRPPFLEQLPGPCWGAGVQWLTVGVQHKDHSHELPHTRLAAVTVTSTMLDRLVQLNTPPDTPDGLLMLSDR